MYRILATISSFPFYSVLIFVMLSATPFYWSTADSNYKYMGADDYFAPISSLISFYYSIYPFDHLGGAGTDQPFLIALLPVNAFYYVMDLLGATPLFATILLLSLQIFVAQIAFYSSLKYFITCKLLLTNNYIASSILGAIAYGFSPFFIGEVIPGHGMGLFVYAFFPLIIRYLDALLISDKFDYAAATILFIMLALCSPGFSNIGNLYAFFMAAGIYSLSIALAATCTFWRGMQRFTLFVIIAFLSNLWWLTPHLYNLKNYIAISHTQGGEMTDLVAYASKTASILNIFQGKPELLMYMTNVVGNDYYISSFQSIIYLSITLLVIYATLNRHRQVYVMLFAALCSIMLLKGIQDPFSSLFIWAYDNIPGFQVMRRPTAKFYGFFLYFFLAAATFGFVILINKYIHKKRLVNLLLGLGGVAAGYMVCVFALTPSLKTYNIPERYVNARDFLMRDQVERVLFLPVASGWRPHYKSRMNSYTGIDFVDEFFRFPKISAPSYLLAINENYFHPANELIQRLHNNQSICEFSRTLGVSHIVVRDDLELSLVEVDPKKTAKILDIHSDIAQKTSFSDQSGSQFIVYKLKPECSGNLISVGGIKSKFSYELRNPGKIVINIEGLRGAVTLDFLYQYNENWDLYVGDSKMFTNKEAENFKSSVVVAYNEPHSMKLRLNELQYLFKKSPFNNSHEVTLHYANKWTIDPALLRIEKENESITSNGDGSVNAKLVLYYRPQAYLLLGIVMSLGAFMCLLLLRIYSGPQLSDNNLRW